MSQATILAKVGERELALLQAKALGLVLAKCIVPDESTGGYVDLVGGYQIDIEAGTCSCPWYEANHEAAERIERLETEILLAETESERNIKVRFLSRLPLFEGDTCKHLLAAQMVANLVDLAAELRCIMDRRLREEARLVCRKQRDGKLEDLQRGTPHASVHTVHTYQAAPKPLLVPVIKVRGLVGKNAQGIRVVNTIWEDNARLTQQIFQMDRTPEGQFAREESLAKAKDRWPEDRYVVEEVLVKAEKASGYATL